MSAEPIASSSATPSASALEPTPYPDLRNGKVGGRPPNKGDGTDPLTSRQELFVAEYLVDLNGTQAAIRAGYSPDTARSMASSLLAKPNVQAAVKRAYARAHQALSLKAQRVLSELATLAFSDARELFDDDGRLLPVRRIPDSIAPAISSVKVTKRVVQVGEDSSESEYVSEVKLWSKTEGLKLLAKHFGLLRDVIEHTGPDGSPLQVSHSHTHDHVSTQFADLNADDKREMLQILERARARKLAARGRASGDQSQNADVKQIGSGTTQQAAAAQQVSLISDGNDNVIDLMPVESQDESAGEPANESRYARCMIADMPHGFDVDDVEE